MEQKITGKGIPEAFHIALTVSGDDVVPVIRDDQYHIHIKFVRGRHTFSKSQHQTVIENTCRALEVEQGLWVNSCFISVEDFIGRYIRTYVES